MTFGRLGVLGQMSNLGMSGPAGAVIRIATPSVTSPADAATDIGETPTITSSAFAVTNEGVDTHASTDWQIASDSDFGTIVVQSLADASNKVSWAVPSGNLSTSTEYFIRVRHNGTTYGASGWSSTVRFTTASAFSYTWTNTEGATFAAAMSGTYSDAKLALLDTYISNLKSGLDNGTSTWGGHDVLGLHFLDNATDARRWFNSPSTLMTAVNSPTHTAGEGYAGDGTSAAINTNFTPSTDGVQFAQNSASLAVWMRSVGSSALKAFAGALDGSKNSLVYRQADGSVWRAIGPNGGVVDGTTLSQSATGLIGGNRSGSTATQVYRNGSSEGTGSTSSLALNTNEIFLLARNNTSPDLHSDGQISISHIGRSFTSNEWADIYAADNALLAAWAAA